MSTQIVEKHFTTQTKLQTQNEFAQTRNRIVRGDAGLIPLSAIDNYYKDPQNVSRPRLVRLGFSF